ncbi:MAG: phytanoyl-CoA dioxygenase family protein [Fimbriimonas sp.]
MALMQSLNSAAESRQLPAWTSWKDGRPAGYFDLPMTAEASAFYAENGFLVLDQALNMEEVQQLRKEATRICRGELGQVGGVTPPEPGETDEEIIRRYLCIHFPHKISDLMRGTLAHPAIVAALTSVISPNVKCMQSMLFIKASGKPGQAWHQDEIYIPTRDRSLAGAWIAMDDATVENGCLWVIPGSQKAGVLYLQTWHGDSRFDCALEAQNFPYTNDDAVPVEVKAGSIVFFNGYLLHRSLPNYASAGFRRSLVNHYMSAESFLPWYGASIPDDQPVSTADHRDITLIAGVDPYAFKGTENRHGVHVRPSGEGGCGSMKYNEAAGTDARR